MFLPLLVSTEDPRYGAEHLLEDFTQDLDVGYSFGPPYGNRLVTWDDLDELELSQRELRQVAVDNLYRLLPRLRIDGQPPAPMLSFGGLESTVLLAAEVWEDLERSVPGELVVGVPARDVVIFTGTESRPGMAKVRRAVDRIFFAGDQNLLSPDLLVWQEGAWSTFEPAGPVPEPPPERWGGPGQQPDQWAEPESEPDRERWDSPDPDRDRARWQGQGGPVREPEPDRWRRPEPEPGAYRVPRQRSGDAGPTDWPERPPARRSKRRKPRPNGSTR